MALQQVVHGRPIQVRPCEGSLPLTSDATSMHSSALMRISKIHSCKEHATSAGRFRMGAQSGALRASATAHEWRTAAQPSHSCGTGGPCTFGSMRHAPIAHAAKARATPYPCVATRPKRSAPGSTRHAPTSGAANTRPQLLAWNMGTTARTRLALPSAAPSTPVIMNAAPARPGVSSQQHNRAQSHCTSHPWSCAPSAPVIMSAAPATPRRQQASSACSHTANAEHTKVVLNTSHCIAISVELRRTQSIVRLLLMRWSCAP